MSLLGASTTLH